MECEKYERLMPDLEWLDEKDRKSLSEHAGSCPGCAEKLKMINSLGECLMNGKQEADMDRLDLSDNVMRRLDEERGPASFKVLHAVAFLLFSELALLLFAGQGRSDISTYAYSAVDYLKDLLTDLSAYVPEFSAGETLSGYFSFDMGYVVSLVLAAAACTFIFVKFVDERRALKK